MVLLQSWYTLSKTLAEEGAWKFAKENGIDLVSINPGFAIGPLLQPTVNLTVEMILNHLNGTFEQMVFPFITCSRQFLYFLFYLQITLEFQRAIIFIDLFLWLQELKHCPTQFTDLLTLEILHCRIFKHLKSLQLVEDIALLDMLCIYPRL